MRVMRSSCRRFLSCNHSIALLTALAFAAIGWRAAAASAAQAIRPAGRLSIAVIAGEQAVNIIQQGTAVAPVVEVRDRNNQPVSGSVVTFAIRGGRATFSGARTVTVTTDAAGRATVTGFTPTSSGTFQISASASFQSQTATVTIAQTNVMTAVQAAQIVGAAASASTGAGGAAGAAGGSTAAGGGAAAGASAAATGGGLSAVTTLGIVGGAVAGGTLVARQVVVGGYTDYEGPLHIQIVETSNNDGPGTLCTSTLAFDGTLAVEFQDGDNGTIVGEMTTDFSRVEIARTCRNAKGAIDSFHRTTTLSGTPADVRMTDGSSLPSGGETITFAGAVNGESLVGTWSIVGSYTGPAQGGYAYSAVTPLTSVSVTLAKQ